MARVEFGGVTEEVVTREEFSLDRARSVLEGETVAVLGYGVQGPAQAFNLRDNGVRVIIGQRFGTATWDRAIRDGWTPGTSLFAIEEAARRGPIVHYLVSDAAQKALWPTVREQLTADVLLVAPKGSGATVRANFLDGSGINASYAVGRDATGRAADRVLAIGIAIGSGYLFPTTFEKEVYSDLVGERGALMGALAGVMEAQYAVLREHGHSPSEAFNETVEELTQSLIRLVAEYGMDGMFARCSTTAQRGALDWRGRFRDAVAPVFTELYQRVMDGDEARIVLEANAAPTYRRRLEQELREMRESELWRAGAAVRGLRPERQRGR